MLSAVYFLGFPIPLNGVLTKFLFASTGHCLQVKDSQTTIVNSSSVEKSCASESGKTDEVMESEPDAEEGLYDIIFRSLKPFVFCACKYCQGIEKRPQLNFLFISPLSQTTQLNLLYALHIMQSDWQMYKEIS